LWIFSEIIKEYKSNHYFIHINKTWFLSVHDVEEINCLKNSSSMKYSSWLSNLIVILQLYHAFTLQIFDWSQDMWEKGHANIALNPGYQQVNTMWEMYWVWAMGHFIHSIYNMLTSHAVLTLSSLLNHLTISPIILTQKSLTTFNTIPLYNLPYI